jgi:hypothetical protein
VLEFVDILGFPTNNLRHKELLLTYQVGKKISLLI